MKSQLRSALQIAFLLFFVLLLIRFFPLLIRAAEAGAMSIGRFGAVILAIALGGWFVWVLKNRNSG